MTGTVWLSRVQSNGLVAGANGLRTKYFGKTWEEPYPRHQIPELDSDLMENMARYNEGFPLAPHEFPEASAIYDAACFRRAKQLFYPASGFLGARERLAEVLSRFDLGPIGLIPYTIYEADEVTPHPGPFWLIGLGVQKATFLPEESQSIEWGVPNHATGKRRPRISPNVSDGDIALSAAALDGPDLWVEAGFRGNLWMSDRLVQALRDGNFGFEWMLSQCRIRPDLGRLLGFVGEKGTQARVRSACSATQEGVISHAV